MSEVVFVGTTPGLEAVLEEEARPLGEVRRRDGGIELRGAAGLYRRANLRLRTAGRVLLRVADVPAASAGELRAAIEAVSLAPFRPEGAPVAIEAITHGSRLRPREVARVAEGSWDPRGSGDPLSVLLRVDGPRCTVSVDSSGEPLYRRGWRQEISRAPMRETLAAGLLLLAGYQGERPLWDPFCGSGTLPIEAALMALGRAPGIARPFAFERWPGHDAAAWERERAAAHGTLLPLPHPVWGSDLNAGAVGTARRNARRAGLDGALRLWRQDAAAPPPELTGAGLLIANLPFGKRVERDPALHRRLGEALARLPGWRYALLVAGAAERELALAPERIHELSNGGLRCRLLLGQIRR